MFVQNMLSTAPSSRTSTRPMRNPTSPPTSTLLTFFLLVTAYTIVTMMSMTTPRNIPSRNVPSSPTTNPISVAESLRLNPPFLHWQVDSLPLRHQGSLLF